MTKLTRSVDVIFTLTLVGSVFTHINDVSKLADIATVLVAGRIFLLPLQIKG